VRGRVYITQGMTPKPRIIVTGTPWRRFCTQAAGVDEQGDSCEVDIEQSASW